MNKKAIYAIVALLVVVAVVATIVVLSMKNQEMKDAAYKSAVGITTSQKA